MSVSPSLAELEADPHPYWHQARANAPLVWVEALNGWVVVGRDLAIDVMRDPDRFTVDDPRFSTGRILGPSMLSTDGASHARHRAPFVAPYAARAIETAMGLWVRAEADRLVAAFGKEVELRTELAAPLAVNSIVNSLGLDHIGPTQLLDWYRTIVADVQAIGGGANGHLAGSAAYAALAAAMTDDGTRWGGLDREETAANMAVMLFGAIETSEGATTNAFHHLLSHPACWDAICTDPALIPNAVDESLRLEPAAAVIDRYATTDVTVADQTIQTGDFVQISLAAANRDPAHYSEPDQYDIHRANARTNTTFAFGPHACLGIHLARMETIAAVKALAAARPGIQRIQATSSSPTGLVFRKPVAVRARG